MKNIIFRTKLIPSGVVVSMLDYGSGGPGFNPHLRRKLDRTDPYPG